MNVFISVLFVCLNNQCSFMSSNKVYYDYAECVSITNRTKSFLEKQGLEVHGECIPVKESI